MNIARPSSRFIADSPVLDFLNALDRYWRERPASDCDSDALLQWIEEAELVPADAIQILRANAGPGELEAVTVQATALGAWFRAFVEDFKGAPLPTSSIERLQPLNRILQRDAQFTQIDIRDNLSDRIAGSGLKWSSKRVWRSPDMLLLPIAQMMAELICTEDFSNVRACERPGCRLLFLDRTKGHTRRWCSMAVCGNRPEDARPSTQEQ
jgi:hypothetical protein